METQTEKQKPANGQLISVPRKDTIRLLEVYVKRSLSVNDGMVCVKRDEMKQKWVTMPKRHRRHSSDGGLKDVEFVVLPVLTPAKNQPATCPEESEKPTRKSKKKKKPSFWKNVLGFFSRKSGDDNDEEQDGPSEAPAAPEATTTCLPATPDIVRKKSTMRKSIKRRFSKKRLTLTKTIKSGKDLNLADITGVEDVVSVEPTYSYYEKVSEELEKIVHEVNEEVVPLSNEEVINRIVALTKEQGDAIDDKLKDNPTLNNFFQQMTYTSFQKLADACLERESSPTLNPPTVQTTAPELVKLAFTLDFTARIAGLSRQNVGHITGLGNRYLKDRFEYTQACTDHPWADCDH
ncbi:apoptosis facilitator Bcl-2-like protein 14 [Embiotoca jacksoni]|uniref:apoptosis facilitator Bcl-2-like protein 14 n=1 Tax=Embiotoca jacksoni TaxID=100190 RepID=UPI0037042F94